MPLVSICIPTYNTARYLPKAIESVIAQEFSDYELVICDNASTDDTPEICRGYGHPSIRYLRFEEKTGQAGSFNRCLEQAAGEFITILHADDYLLPGFLADRAARLRSNPDIGFVFGAVQVVDAQGAQTSITRRWDADREFGIGELVEYLLFGCIVCPPSLMVRKKAAGRAGFFRTDLTWGHDWEWDLRLAEQNAALYCSEPLAAYRVHDDSGTAEQLNAGKNGRQERLILEQTIGRLESADRKFGKLRRPALQALAHRHMYFAEQALVSGRRRIALNNLWYAALADKKMLTRPTFWAMLTSSAGSVSWYARYRDLRHSIAQPGSGL